MRMRKASPREGEIFTVLETGSYSDYMEKSKSNPFDERITKVKLHKRECVQ